MSFDRCAAPGALFQFWLADFSQQFEAISAVFALLITAGLVFINRHSFHSTVKTVKLPRHALGEPKESGIVWIDHHCNRSSRFPRFRIVREGGVGGYEYRDAGL